MRYKSIFSISFDADDDAAAAKVAHMHHEQVREDLQIEGADHPYEITLEELLEIKSSATRSVLAGPTKRTI